MWDYENHCTRKTTLLDSVPLGVFTRTVPVVAPFGTVATISVAETIVNAASVPLKATWVEPVRLVPSILTLLPTARDVGTNATNCPRPVDNLKTVPQPAPLQRLAP